MDAPLVNRIATSGLVTINLENYYPKDPISVFDLKDFLFKGLVLKEKDFRQSLKEFDWSKYDGHVLCILCSTDAIIPVWAYMLVSKYANDYTKEIFVGTKEEYIKSIYRDVIKELDVTEYNNGKIIVKGCSNLPVPAAAYTLLSAKLQPVVKSIMYGEPCSTVPIYKKPLRRVR